jgi:hypothetical protein
MFGEKANFFSTDGTVATEAAWLKPRNHRKGKSNQGAAIPT